MNFWKYSHVVHVHSIVCQLQLMLHFLNDSDKFQYFCKVQIINYSRIVLTKKTPKEWGFKKNSIKSKAYVYFLLLAFSLPVKLRKWIWTRKTPKLNQKTTTKNKTLVSRVGTPGTICLESFSRFAEIIYDKSIKVQDICTCFVQ